MPGNRSAKLRRALRALAIALPGTALAAALLLASGGAIAQAPAPAQPAPRPAVIAPPMLLRVDRLTDEQVQRLEKVALDRGTSIAVPPPIAAALHLEAAQIAPVVRQVSFQKDDGIKHGFARLNDGSGYFLFAREPNGGVTVFRVNREFGLLGAAHTFAGDRLMPLQPAVATDRLHGEILAWSALLSPPTAVMPPARQPGSGAGAPVPDTPGSPAPR